MSAHTIAYLRQELERAREALIDAQIHLAAQAQTEAALSMASSVTYSPLHAHVTDAIGHAARALERTAY